MQSGNIDLLFPSRAIDPLRKLRGEQWEDLIDRLVEMDSTNHDRIAFVLFMVRLGNCTTCQSDSFKAMRGCLLCSSNTVRRFKGDDQELIDLYEEAKKEIISYLREV